MVEDNDVGQVNVLCKPDYDDDVVEDAHGQGADIPVEPVAAPPAPADDLVVNADGQGVDIPADPVPAPPTDDLVDGVVEEADDVVDDVDGDQVETLESLSDNRQWC